MALGGLRYIPTNAQLAFRKMTRQSFWDVQCEVALPTMFKVRARWPHKTSQHACAQHSVKLPLPVSMHVLNTA